MDKKQNGYQQDPLDLVNQYEEQIREWAKGINQSSPMAMDILEKCISDATNLANRFYGVQELKGVYPSIPPSNDFAGILDQAIQLKNQNIRIRMLSWIEVYSTTQLEQLKAAAELVDMIIDDCRNKRKVQPQNLGSLDMPDHLSKLIRDADSIIKLHTILSELKIISGEFLNHTCLLKNSDFWKAHVLTTHLYNNRIFDFEYLDGNEDLNKRKAARSLLHFITGQNVARIKRGWYSKKAEDPENPFFRKSLQIVERILKK